MTVGVALVSLYSYAGKGAEILCTRSAGGTNLQICSAIIVALTMQYPLVANPCISQKSGQVGALPAISKLNM